MTTYFKKGRGILLLILVGLSPFHAFLITWLKSATGKSSIIEGFSAWREMVIVLIGICIVIELIYKKKVPQVKAVDLFIMGYVLLAFLWLPFQTGAARDNLSKGGFTQWALGFRFDVIPLLFYLMAKQVEWKRYDIVKALIISGLIVMIFGILHATILPRDFLTHFGYSTSQGELQPDSPISGCQYLEHTDRVCRATSTFGGPTRYGSYLLLLLGMGLALFGAFKGHTTKRLLIAGFVLLALGNIFLTYSRSIWVATLGMIFLFGLLHLKEKKWIPWNKKTAVVSGIITLLLVTAGVFSYQYLQRNQNGPAIPQFFKSLFVRTNSTLAHFSFMEAGIKKVQENPMGTGLGTAGPASARFEKFLTENWYLQIAVEMGVMGGLLFIAICFLLITHVSTQGSWYAKGILLSFVGVCIAGLFTHSFEETTTALLLFGLLGM